MDVDSYTARVRKKSLDSFKHGTCIGSRGIPDDASIFEDRSHKSVVKRLERRHLLEIAGGLKDETQKLESSKRRIKGYG